MTNPFLLAALSMLLFGLFDYVYKLSQVRGVAPPTFIMTQGTFFLLAAISLMLVTGGPQVSPAVVGYGLLAGVAAYTALLLFLRTLRRLDASVATTIFRLSFIPAAVLAFLLLSEEATAAKGVAMGLAALAVVAFASPRLQRTQLRDGTALATLAAATLLWAGVILIYKKASLSGATAPTFFVFQATAFNLSAQSIAYLQGVWGYRREVIRYALPAAAGLFLATLGLFHALRLGNVSVSATIVQMSFVITALLSALFLREQVGPAKAFGLALAVLAVFTFNLPI